MGSVGAPDPEGPERRAALRRPEGSQGTFEPFEPGQTDSEDGRGGLVPTSPRAQLQRSVRKLEKPEAFGLLQAKLV